METCNPMIELYLNFETLLISYVGFDGNLLFIGIKILTGTNLPKQC